MAIELGDWVVVPMGARRDIVFVFDNDEFRAIYEPDIAA
jgi:hypothetical protein